MTLAILTFVMALTVILGAYWFVIVRSEDQTQSSLRRRLKKDPLRDKSRLAILKEAQKVSRVAFINWMLRGNDRLSGLERRIEQAGVSITPRVFFLTTGVIGLAAFLAISFFTRWITLAMVAGLLAASIPWIWLNRKRANRLKAIEEQFPEAIDLIARALRAGHAFSTGIGMVSDEVPAPTGPEFRLLFEQQNFGMPMADAMRKFAERIDLLDARFFVTAVMTQRESGGNLSEVLDNLSSVIRERFTVKRQVRVMSAHGRTTGFILMAMPPVMALILFQLSPDTTSLLLTDPLGIRLLIGAAVLQIIGALIIRKIVNVEY